MLMRDTEGRKKEASKVKQTTRQSYTAHPRQSLFLRKNELQLCVYTHDCACTCMLQVAVHLKCCSDFEMLSTEVILIAVGELRGKTPT